MGALTAVAANRPAAAGPTTVPETVSTMAWLTAWGVAEAAGTVARPLPGPRTPRPSLPAGSGRSSWRRAGLVPEFTVEQHLARQRPAAGTSRPAARANACREHRTR